MHPFENPELNPSERADDLLSRMTLEEKIRQIQSDLQIDTRFHADGKLDVSNRFPEYGNHRSPAHTSHADRTRTPAECAEVNNQFQTEVIAKSRWKVPSLLHEEACHGAEWTNATCFPVPIALAATWDAPFVKEVFDVVAKESHVGGVRQVLAPVINVVRDVRWGRTEESFGEDPYLTTEMGLAAVTAFESHGVASTPKHFIDNYGDGGRDSNAPNTSWRVANEVFFPPFKACVEKGGARSLMAAYNSFDGLPCHAHRKLLTDILRKTWGFDGIVVSDYFAIPGISTHHQVGGDPNKRALEAGVDVALPDSWGDLVSEVQDGRISEETIDQAARNVLKLKFELGVYDSPFADPEEAGRVVRCREHKDMALEAARKAMVLLKNQGDLLPLSKSLKRIGLFGPAARELCLGGYSGPFGGWKGEDTVTIAEGIRAALPESAEITGDREAIKSCDVAIFCSKISEGENSDRSRCSLPDELEEEILAIASAGVPTVVVLINGSPVVMKRWMDQVEAIIEAWYPGEQGGTAAAEVLFGDVNPSGKLPVTWPKSEGQLPLYYNPKPSGRGYGYVGDDGRPLFPFGYGLSYTTFAYSSLSVEKPSIATDQSVKITLDVENTGQRAGDEIVQLYIHREAASVVVPLKELKGFKRVSLQPGEKKTVEFTLAPEEISIWDIDMNFVNEPGTIKVMVGASSDDIRETGEFTIR